MSDQDKAADGQTIPSEGSGAEGIQPEAHAETPIDGSTPDDAGQPEEAPSPFYQSLPEDWRSQAASSLGLEGPDLEGFEKQLGRYKDLPTLLKTFKHGQDMIARGEVSSGLPENPTDEQLAKWREANGIPEAADKYEFNLGEGISLSDDDRAILSKVAAAAHGENLSSSAMNAIGKEFFKLQEEQAAITEARDTEQQMQGEASLKAAWGADYSRNIGIYKTALAGMPESLRDQVQSMRSGDGALLGNNTGFIQWAVDMFSKANPAASVVPAGDGNPMQTIQDQIAEIEAEMSGPEAQQKYWSKPERQKQLQDLYEAQERFNKQNSTA